jgi:hypothetical protein
MRRWLFGRAPTEVVRLEAGGSGDSCAAAHGAGQVQLERGDSPVAFNDGINEAMNQADDEWGE